VQINSRGPPCGDRNTRVFPWKHRSKNRLFAGSLLGLTWNNLILEYDDDLDMQLTIQDLKTLHQWDQTLLESEYLVDVNPHFPYRRIREGDANIIDARVVDVRCPPAPPGTPSTTYTHIDPFPPTAHFLVTGWHQGSRFAS